MAGGERTSSYEARNCGSVIIGENIEIGVVTFQEAFSPREILDGEAAHFAEIGLRSLELADYEMARSALEKSLERALGEPELHYYAALAQLAGRRPKRLNRAEAREIEARLKRATAGSAAAHPWLLYAYFKQDFFVLNGLRVDPPTPHDLLMLSLIHI